MSNAVLITGAAGFIGFHLSQHLLHQNIPVIGFDNLNAYYDVRLKLDRLAELRRSPQFTFVCGDLSDLRLLQNLFQRHQFRQVVNLAAQAGVRYSLQEPMAYVQSNVVGFLNVLECCRHHDVHHLIYASSSSVYGNIEEMPLAVGMPTDRPISLYAATKKSNELMAFTYSHLYGIPITGLRFFTVYGPWGRPDMAPFLFTRAILDGKPINVFNYGKMLRDFTYIDDIVKGILQVMAHPPGVREFPLPTGTRPPTGEVPHRLYNIGNSQPVELLRFISVLEQCLDLKAELNLMPPQPGDVFATYADMEPMKTDFGFEPVTSIEDGVSQFVSWFCSYYKVQKTPATSTV